MNPYAGMPQFTHPHAISPMAGYGQVAPTGEGYEDWIAQEFMTDYAFTAEEVDAAMDRAWSDAVSRGLVESNWYFAGTEAVQDPGTGMWAVKLYYYVPPELADPSRVPGAKKGLPWWGWLGIGLGAVAVTTTIVLIVKRRPRRRRK